MPLDHAEIEGMAQTFRREVAGDEPDSEPLRSIIAVARGALGRAGVSLALHRGLVRDAALLWEYDRPLILVRPGLEHSPPRLAWCVAHELGEYLLQLRGYEEPDVEYLANALAGALLMPQTRFARAFGAHGFDLEALSEEFCAPQSAVALRIGEVCGVPLALVTPTRVHRRDPGEQLPDNATLYLLARVPRVPREFLRAEVTDARRHTAVSLVA